MYDDMTAKRAAEREYETTQAEERNQVPGAMAQLRTTIERLQHESGRLLDRCTNGMQPSSPMVDKAGLSSVPREPVAPLVIEIEDAISIISRVADDLYDAANRMQL